MSSFRDQLGEDWLRYQHHLDGSSSNNQPRPQTSSLPSYGNPVIVPPLAPKAAEVLPPAWHSSEAEEPGDVDEEEDTESTLQWPAHSPQPAESTAEGSVVEGSSFGQTRLTAELKVSTKGDSEGSKEEEEEDLGGESLATFTFFKRRKGDCGHTRACVCAEQPRLIKAEGNGCLQVADPSSFTFLKCTFVTPCWWVFYLTTRKTMWSGRRTAAARGGRCFCASSRVWCWRWTCSTAGRDAVWSSAVWFAWRPQKPAGPVG